jgi:pyruvate dehydrogenase kinase 2/3/4
MRGIKNLLSKNIYSAVNTLATINETKIQKSQLIGMNKLSQSNRILAAAPYLFEEMPIRLSGRIKELEKLPFNINDYCEITESRERYSQSLIDISNTPYPDSLEKCQIFHDTTLKIVNRHNSTLYLMAKGIHKLKKSGSIEDEFDLNVFLSNFYRNRTRLRLLLQNFIAYFDKEKENHVGIINLNCNIVNIINHAAEDVQIIAQQNHLDAPDVNIDIKPLQFTYVDSYLHYVLLEILKNCVKATNDANNTDIPISITSYSDNNIYILKIADKGIGIKEKNLNKIWNYSYSTSEIEDDNLENNLTNPISGFGYGLPISKVILKTFGDNINVFSEHGEGTDVYIFIDLKNDWLI